MFNEEILHINHIDGTAKSVCFKDVPPHKYQAVPEYMEDAFEGYPHPLGIDNKDSMAKQKLESYSFLIVHETYMSESVQAQNHQVYFKAGLHFSQEEQKLIQDVQRYKEVSWAMQNSFDGLYVRKFMNPEHYETAFQFGVYMLDQHITYWQLKFGNTR